MVKFDNIVCSKAHNHTNYQLFRYAVLILLKTNRFPGIQAPTKAPSPWNITLPASGTNPGRITTWKKEHNPGRRGRRGRRRILGQDVERRG